MEITDLLPCAVLIPSLGRPQRLADVAKNVELNTDLDHEILWCVGGLQSLRALENEKRVLDDTEDEDKRYVTRMNKLVTWAVELGFKTAFFGSDDVIHHDGWLGSALATMVESRRSVVVVNDMRNPSGTQALIRLDYLPFLTFDNAKTAFHSGYRHNYADTEQQMTAHKYDQHVRAMDSHVEHLHPIYQNQTSRPWDDTYRNAMSFWSEDAERFNRRIGALSEEPDEEVLRKTAAIARLWND